MSVIVGIDESMMQASIFWPLAALGGFFWGICLAEFIRWLRERKTK